jgi:hypothetical protein
MKACWFTSHEQGGFPVERAALGSCDLSVLHIAGEWQWLVRQDGRDIGEGAALSADDAKLEAETVALKRLPRYDRNSPEKRLIGYARVSIYGQTCRDAFCNGPVPTFRLRDYAKTSNHISP